MTIYESEGFYFKNKEEAEKYMKNIAVKYFKENPLDEGDLENLPCGGKQYVADRRLKRDRATIVSYIKVIKVQ